MTRRQAVFVAALGSLGAAAIVAVVVIVAAATSGAGRGFAVGLGVLALIGLLGVIAVVALHDIDDRRTTASLERIQHATSVLTTRTEALQRLPQFEYAVASRLDALTRRSDDGEPLPPTPPPEPAQPTVAAVAPARYVEADELPAKVWTEPNGERPSFMYKLHESKRRQKLLPLLDHRQRVWAYNGKMSGYRLASNLDVATPQTYVAGTTIDGLDWGAMPPRFAIKPHNGANNRGVFLLVHVDGDTYVDLMDGGRKSIGEITDRYAKWASEGVSERFAVEELLEPRSDLAQPVDIPDDLKVYCFYDRPTVIMQRRMHGVSDRKKWRFKVWTAQWAGLGPVKYPDRYDPDLERPPGGDDVLASAASIARFLAVPFIRLDFYDTARGPVFGELSPHPGPPEVWAPDADEMLGREWEIAEARLLADRILPSEPRPPR